VQPHTWGAVGVLCDVTWLPEMAGFLLLQAHSFDLVDHVSLSGQLQLRWCYLQTIVGQLQSVLS
jgi:hypothetical protein